MGVVDRLPEHWKQRKTADALFSPSSIVLAGAGAAAAILGGLPIVAVALVGAGAWVARVAMQLPRKPREHVDPLTISEPWRGFVGEALDAQRRYRRAVATASSGPLRTRLVEIGSRVDAGVQECWRIARRADTLSGAIAELDTDRARRQLEETRREGSVRRSGNHDAMVAALEAQVESADRLAGVARDAEDRLRLLDARLDEVVARAVELAIRAEDVGELAALGGDVDALVGEMESLRAALDEADGTPAPSTGG